MTKPDITDGHKSDDGKDEFSVNEWANRMVIYSKGAEIRTVDQLLSAAQVDTSIWEICGRPHLNKWTIGAKVKDSSIEFDDGRMSGKIDEHGLVLAPMFQVKITLVRKRPVEIIPVIQPVECKEQFIVLPQKPLSFRKRRVLIFADNQIGYNRDMATGVLTPYHDRQCLDIALQVARYAQVDDVIIAGDFLDLAEWSDKFIRSPEFYQTTQPSIEEAFFWLRQFRENLPSATIQIKLGNHEQRMKSMIAKSLPFAYGLKPVEDDITIDVPPALSLRNLLQLDRLAVDFDSNPSSDVEWLNNNFGVCHGDVIRQVPGATARIYAEKYRHSIAFFHTHRAESVTLTTESSFVATAINPGCMCRLDGIVPGSKKSSTWSNGFLIADYDNGDMVTFTPVQVMDGFALYDRTMFQANQESYIIEKLGEMFGRWKWS